MNWVEILLFSLALGGGVMTPFYGLILWERRKNARFSKDNSGSRFG